MEKIVNSTEETAELARKIGEKLKSKDVIALYGELGTGKTTFTKYLVDSLCITARVQSPTFVIIRTYTAENKNSKINKVNHIDLYRLKKEHEAKQLGITEYFNEPGSITIIEWPELAEDLLPERTIKVIFEDLGKNKRKINVQNLY